MVLSQVSITIFTEGGYVPTPNCRGLNAEIRTDAPLPKYGLKLDI